MIIHDLNEHEKRQLEIMDYYNAGYTYKEIARFMFMSVNTIKTIVNNWINSLPSYSQEFIRKKHKIEKCAKKETVKAVDYEVKKEIGDKAFILKNRSAYNTKNNGDIILKSENELGCKTTYDTPKRFVNEGKEKIIKQKELYCDKNVEFEVSDYYSRDIKRRPKILSKSERNIISKYVN
ncbi:DNA-binding response regulator [Clostridium perfringens]|uniref:DNA-binding response regulator n=1 Tax=Clostridium perfringens TaxID=1502 RepID=UPI0024BCAB4E|nr:DNA-binding response regulator [Clostridium perfringens]